MNDYKLRDVKRLYTVQEIQRFYQISHYKAKYLAQFAPFSPLEGLLYLMGLEKQADLQRRHGLERLVG